MPFLEAEFVPLEAGANARQQAQLAADR